MHSLHRRMHAQRESETASKHTRGLGHTLKSYRGGGLNLYSFAECNKTGLIKIKDKNHIVRGATHHLHS